MKTGGGLQRKLRSRTNYIRQSSVAPKPRPALCLQTLHPASVLMYWCGGVSLPGFHLFRCWLFSRFIYFVVGYFLGMFLDFMDFILIVGFAAIILMISHIIFHNLYKNHLM